MENYADLVYEHIKVWAEDGIGYVQMNRPQSFNAVSAKGLDENYEVLVKYNLDPEIKVVIFCGHENVFCAGADLVAVKAMTAFEARNFLDKVHRNLFFIEELNKPAIAAIQGLALGGGLELAMACDLAVAADNSTFGLPEINLGIFPGGGGTQRMIRHSSVKLVKQYIFTGDFFNAQIAQQMGVINMVVPSNEVMATAVKLAKRISRKSPLAIREAKHAINVAMNTDLKTGCRAEQLAWSMMFSSDDQKEGMTAFMESRKPDFKGK
ncbi:MAG: enoyl-CoA hydratase/isomerase family protein [Acidobacteriota bacterium]